MVNVFVEKNVINRIRYMGVVLLTIKQGVFTSKKENIFGCPFCERTDEKVIVKKKFAFVEH